MKKGKRYKETGFHYAKYYLVECPECDKEAIVTPCYCKQESKLECKNCFITMKQEKMVYYKVSAKLNCPCCGKEISHQQSGLKQKPAQVTLTCPECDSQFSVKPRAEKWYMKSTNQGVAHDLVFGFPLWFQTEVRGNLLWAYNREHLTEIETYVASQLRERQGGRLMTMVAKLPQFIKDAKNRELILHKIEELKKR